MAFTTFVSYTTLSASEMNGNFQWVGGGNWLPRGGASLDTTTGVYDIGSSSYVWDNIYTNNLDISGQSNTGCWNVVASVTLSSTASSIEFTGLKNDIYMMEGIIIDKISNTAYHVVDLQIVFNNDSASNYGFKFRGMSGSGLFLHNVTTNYIRIGFTHDETVSSHQICFNIIFHLKPGSERIAIINSIGGVSTFTSYWKYFGGGIWNNTIDTITSIKLVLLEPNVSFKTNTSVRLWSPL